MLTWGKERAKQTLDRRRDFSLTPNPSPQGKSLSKPEVCLPASFSPQGARGWEDEDTLSGIEFMLL
ncbi:MAG: hypothetical protein HC936_18125 [Leptolyngbyaceae cyanobacterium SU_3_3]|nr:hypothetical protein [Leptolyngbyaceae cyanobacterium SU_3_3]